MAGITPGNPTLVTTVEDERLEFQDGALLCLCVRLLFVLVLLLTARRAWAVDQPRVVQVGLAELIQACRGELQLLFL